MIECFMISKYRNKDVYVISSFENRGVIAPSYEKLRGYIIQELENALRKWKAR